MDPTIQSGQHLAQCADLGGSRFEDVNLGGAEFENVNLAGASFHDINMSDISISAAQIGGASFKHIGPPPNTDGAHERQRGVTFEEMHLNDSTFRCVDLSNVTIADCSLDGMTIDAVLVTDLIACWAKNSEQVYRFCRRRRNKHRTSINRLDHSTQSDFEAKRRRAWFLVGSSRSWCR